VPQTNDLAYWFECVREERKKVFITLTGDFNANTNPMGEAKLPLLEPLQLPSFQTSAIQPFIGVPMPTLSPTQPYPHSMGLYLPPQTVLDGSQSPGQHFQYPAPPSPGLPNGNILKEFTTDPIYIDCQTTNLS
jgi:hypothetical protein